MIWQGPFMHIRFHKHQDVIIPWICARRYTKYSASSSSTLQTFRDVSHLSVGSFISLGFNAPKTADPQESWKLSLDSGQGQVLLNFNLFHSLSFPLANLQLVFHHFPEKPSGIILTYLSLIHI